MCRLEKYIGKKVIHEERRISSLRGWFPILTVNIFVLLYRPLSLLIPALLVIVLALSHNAPPQYTAYQLTLHINCYSNSTESRFYHGQLNSTLPP